jgi:hypothetical protein
MEARVLSIEPVHPYGSFWSDIADKAIKAIALVIGGVWTYRDSFRAKVESEISGEAFSRDGKHYLIMTARLKNLGKSKYIIRKVGTYIGAEAIDNERNKTSIFASAVFEDHAWIEPEEIIQDSVITEIPSPTTCIALKLNLRIVSRRFFAGIEWNATSILQVDNSTNSLPLRKDDSKHAYTRK